MSPYPGCMDKDKFYKTAFRGTSVERQQKDSSGNEKKTDDLTQPKTVRENSILLIARQGNGAILWSMGNHRAGRLPSISEVQPSRRKKGGRC